MRKSIYLTPLLVFFCAMFSSCNIEIFAHSYLSGSAESAYVDTNPAAPGISGEDGEDDGGGGGGGDNGSDFLVVNLCAFSWGEFLNIFGSSTMD